MKKILFFTGLAIACSMAQAQTWVDGYTRRDGTYVEGHMRSAPNQNRYDNYNAENSVYGGNPYTGQRGHQRDEFSDPPTYNPSYGQERRSSCYRNAYGNRVCD